MSAERNFVSRFLVSFFCTCVLVFCSAVSFNVRFVVDYGAIFAAFIASALVSMLGALISACIIKRKDWLMIVLSQSIAIVILSLIFSK